MGTTTFTGPIKAGNILNTSGTTIGTDVTNVGYVIMSQSATVNQATNVSSAGVYKTNIVLPKGSQVLRIDVFKTAAWSGAAQTINVGKHLRVFSQGYVVVPDQAVMANLFFRHFVFNRAVFLAHSFCFVVGQLQICYAQIHAVPVNIKNRPVRPLTVMKQPSGSGT